MRRVQVKSIFILVCLLITVTSYAFAFQVNTPPDTVKKPVESNSFLKEKVTYSAVDSMMVDMTNQKAYLYGNAVVLYEDLKLQAGYIELDFAKNLVHATGIQDSVGKTVQRPVFEQNPDKFTADTITYNFETKKGKIKGVITQQGDGYIHGRDIKKDTNNTYYVSHGKYTTCDLDHPHYYIGAKKIKVIPNDKIITGPAELYIADIPTPLVLPFGYFPNKQGRRSGILIPEYGESQDLGFFLKNGGFYFGGSEKVDLALQGDIYANGSFGLKAASNYKNRYHYNGNLNLSYARIITGDRELPNSTIQNTFFIRWSHTQDPKAHPDSRFSANVNAGSSSYNKYSGSVTGDYLTNTFQSNISYSKTFTGTPFNFSANMRHNQNTITKKIDITLPELALTMNRIYPFKSKVGSGNKWYDKIGISATANARNDISSYDTILFTNQTLQQMQNGLRIAVPISTSFNLFKYIVVTPSISTSSNIYFQSIRKRYDPNIDHVFTDTLNEVKTANDFSASTGMSTRLYGDYFFKTKHLKQIRHVASPTLSFTYRPDFSDNQFGYFRSVQSDANGTIQQYSIFQNGIYGQPSSGESGLVSFSLNNTLEAKMKHESDSGAVYKKASIFDNLGFNVAYNIAAKNYNWSNINLSGRTKLFKKLDINALASLDPYQVDSSYQRIERFEFDKGKIGRLTTASLSLSSNFKSKSGNSKPKTSTDKNTQDELDYINKHPEAYVDFNVPWNLNVYYNFNYNSKTQLSPQTLTQTVSFNGDLSLTKKWKISLSSGYDFTNKKISITSINIYRDLHCWEMHFNWVPFGFRQSFSVDINVKSSMLKDLKLRKRGGYNYQ